MSTLTPRTRADARFSFAIELRMVQISLVHRAAERGGKECQDHRPAFQLVAERHRGGLVREREIGRVRAEVCRHRFTRSAPATRRLP